MQKNEWPAGLSWLNVTLTSKWQIVKWWCKLSFVWPLRLTWHTSLVFSYVLTNPSPKVLADVSQLLAPAYGRVAASVILTDCAIQVYIPLIVWHSETGCSDIVMLKPNLLKRCFTTTLMHRLSQLDASQDSIPNMQTHEVHSVKPSIDLSSHVTKTGGNYLQIEVSIAQKQSQHFLWAIWWYIGWRGCMRRNKL